MRVFNERSLRCLVRLFAALLALAPAIGHTEAPQAVRVGYFPNITHAAALIGLADSTFQKALGPSVTIKTFAFNAGPAAIEALFAGELDVAYVGPNPAINAHVRSRGEIGKIVAGACSGGAALVVRKGSGIRSPSELKFKRIATPQLANTQDVAARTWLKRNGIQAELLPIANADQLTLFQRGQLDAAWAPEPWATRLIREGSGELLLDERTLWENGRFPTAVLLMTTKFLKERPAQAKAWLDAHVDVSRKIAANSKDAQKVLNRELKRLTGKELPPALLEEAMSRLEISYDPLPKALLQFADAAFQTGFLGRKKPEIAGLVDLGLLNEILGAKRLPTIPGQ